MAKFRVTAPDGGTYEVTAPDDATQEQVISFAQKQFAPSAEVKPEQPATFGQKLQASVPGRMVQGLRDVASGTTQAIAHGAAAAFPSLEPSVKEYDEILAQREKDYQAARQATGSSGMDIARGLGSVAATLSPMSRVPVAQTMKGRAAIGAGVGAVAGAAQPVLEDQENFALQKAKQVGVGMLVGGVTTPLSELAIKAGVGAFNKVAEMFRGRSNVPKVEIEITLKEAVEQNGGKWAEVPENVRNTLRDEVRDALKTGGKLDPEALRRRVDFEVANVKPLKGNLTLDPVDITRQKNLAKVGANSNDSSLQQLALAENQQNKDLITSLGKVAGGGDDAYSAGEKIINSLRNRDEATKSVVNALYGAARNTEGRSANLNPAAFAQKANDLLDDALLGGKLPADVRNKMNQVATGKMPFTVDVAEQFKTRIGDLQRASRDPAERKALGLVRQAIDEAPLVDQLGAEAQKAFTRARTANRARMGVIEETPALKAAIEGVEPDHFVKKFVLNNSSTAKDLIALRKSISSDPEAKEAARTQLVSWLKEKALSGASDEVGNFSQAGYNKALGSISNQKLAVFFTPQEIAKLKTIGRVASYTQVQPRGSAVNNSNTASTAFALLDKVVDKIPLGKVIAGDPLREIVNSRVAGKIINPALQTSMDPTISKNALKDLLKLSPALGVSLGGLAANELK